MLLPKSRRSNGRKSDGFDAQPIAEYLKDGRLDASFVPLPEIGELRMLLRHRVSLLEQRSTQPDPGPV